MHAPRPVPPSGLWKKNEKYTALNTYSPSQQREGEAAARGPQLEQASKARRGERGGGDGGRGFAYSAHIWLPCRLRYLSIRIPTSRRTNLHTVALKNSLARRSRASTRRRSSSAIAA